MPLAGRWAVQAALSGQPRLVLFFLEQLSHIIYYEVRR